MKFRLAVVTVLAFLILSVAAQRARGCTCAPPEIPKDELKHSLAVFVGIVTKIESQQNGQIATYDKTTFTILRTWKGTTGRQQVMETINNPGMCGYPFRVGETYLVYAYNNGMNKLDTSLCSRTRPEKYAQTDFIDIGPGRAPAPAPATEEEAVF